MEKQGQYVTYVIPQTLLSIRCVSLWAGFPGDAWHGKMTGREGDATEIKNEKENRK